jgi:hypothetical protein
MIERAARFALASDGVGFCKERGKQVAVHDGVLNGRWGGLIRAFFLAHLTYFLHFANQRASV